MDSMLEETTMTVDISANNYAKMENCWCPGDIKHIVVISLSYMSPDKQDRVVIYAIATQQ